MIEKKPAAYTYPGPHQTASRDNACTVSGIDSEKLPHSDQRRPARASLRIPIASFELEKVLDYLAD